jgi:hypothetical protein
MIAATATEKGISMSPPIRGHSLYVKDNRLHYAYNFVGSFVQTVVADEQLSTGENLILSAAFDRDGEDPQGVSTCTLSLYHGEQQVGEQRIKTQSGMFGISGTGLTVGRSVTAITDDYPGERPRHFRGGTLQFVAVGMPGLVVLGEPEVHNRRERSRAGPESLASCRRPRRRILSRGSLPSRRRTPGL